VVIRCKSSVVSRSWMTACGLLLFPSHGTNQAVQHLSDFGKQDVQFAKSIFR